LERSIPIGPGALPANPGTFPVPQRRSAGVLIPTRSEKQAMDWSLALASQHIACAIHAIPAALENDPSPATGPAASWALEVDARDAGRALRVLRIYHQENRHWTPHLEPTHSAFPFQWTVLLWCFLMTIVHSAAEAPGSLLPLAGRFETARFVLGEWWRPMTATFLHSNLDHLVANLTSGFIVLGLAIGRFRAGPALFLSYLAGSLANIAAWLLRSRDYIGVGSSGVVMAGLGLLAVSLLSEFREGKASTTVVTRGLLGGTALFLLLGTSPQSDVLAHAAGFGFGAALAALYAFIPTRITQGNTWDMTSASLFLASATVPWLAALS